MNHNAAELYSVLRGDGLIRRMKFLQAMITLAFMA